MKLMKFENNVPVPKTKYNREHGRIQDEMRDNMKVGDSTIIETENFNAFRVGLNKKCKDWKFANQKISDNQYRVWRIL